MPLPQINVVQLTLTNRCQCNCEHCGVATLREAITGELSLAQIDLLFRDLRIAGCRVVDLFGGEPTLRRDLFEIIVRAKSYGFIVSLETNGFVVDGPYIERLQAAGLDQIYLSLDDYRAEQHDRRRRRSGSFERAVRALELGAQTGITMHVSIVPQTPEFFTGGDMNRFMQFVLDRGAEKVRLLLPRFVGHSVHEHCGPVAAGRETSLFSCVSPQYHDFIYVHTPGTPLGERNLCTAKQVFCHVMSNGWVAPCPYFPLVFGDATREPVVDVFERIQSHPLVRQGGDYCPMRSEEYINTHMRPMGLEHPFFPITMKNQVDLGAPCSSACPGCSYGTRSGMRPVDEIDRDLAGIESEYTRVEFYGGDAFSRHDLFSVLDRVPRTRKIILWTSCRTAPDLSRLDRLRSYAIGAVRVLVDDPAAAVQHLRSLGSSGLPVHLFIPLERIDQARSVFGANPGHLGVERVYTFTREDGRPLENAVACFGRGLDRVRLLWAQREAAAART